jgi:pyruvate formate lyase activating enzyme
MQSGLVFNVQRFSLQDGPGLRSTVFLKGCPLACAWCHNPESQAPRIEYLRLGHRCMACGICSDEERADPLVRHRNEVDVAACPTGALQAVGQEMLTFDLVKRLLRDRIFFDESGGGVTFSGGEPLLQASFVIEAMRLLRAEGVHTALDTCGYGNWKDLAEAAEHACLVLYDLKLMDEGRHKAATGVSNRIILQNLKDLSEIHSNLWIRIPIIPGINDDRANLETTAAFLGSLPGIQQVDLLPYHPMGESKSPRVGIPCQLHAVPTPTIEDLEAMAALFRAKGLHATIGGRP